MRILKYLRIKLNGCEDSTQMTTPLLSPTINHQYQYHDQIATCFPRVICESCGLNILLAQKSPIINDSSPKSVNSYLIVDLSCTSTSNIFLYTLIIQLFNIQSISFYLNYTCTNLQLSLFNYLFLFHLLIWLKKFFEQLLNKQS